MNLRQSTSTGNYIKNVSGNGINANTTTYNTIINNVIDGFGENGIYATKDATGILHNTINDSTGPAGYVIISCSGAVFYVAHNNNITAVDSSGAAINITSGGNNAINGPNAYYNNPTNHGGTKNPAPGLNLTGDDVHDPSSTHNAAETRAVHHASPAHHHTTPPPQLNAQNSIT